MNNKPIVIFSLLIITLWQNVIGTRIIGEVTKQKCKEYLSNITSNKEESQFNHLAVVLYDNDNEKSLWGCSGVLISDQFVLTAAHCVLTRFRDTASDFIKLGVKNLKTNDENTQIFNISTKLLHPDYNARTHLNDVALLKIDRPANFTSKVRPACLSTKTEITESEAILWGYGKQYFADNLQKSLRRVLVNPSFSIADCKKEYEPRKIDEKGQFCGKPVPENEERFARNICQGDSGSPLQIFNSDLNSYEVIGLAVYGKTCNEEPAVYIKVSHYIKWIEDIVWP